MDELHNAKLTKKFLMGLPNGVYLMSNMAATLNKSIFGEYVISPIAEREKQWDRIKLAGADNRLCRIFKTENQAINWIESFESQ